MLTLAGSGIGRARDIEARSYPGSESPPTSPPTSPVPGQLLTPPVEAPATGRAPWQRTAGRRSTTPPPSAHPHRCPVRCSTSRPDHLVRDCRGDADRSGGLPRDLPTRGGRTASEAMEAHTPYQISFQAGLPAARKAATANKRSPRRGSLDAAPAKSECQAITIPVHAGSGSRWPAYTGIPPKLLVTCGSNIAGGERARIRMCVKREATYLSADQ